MRSSAHKIILVIAVLLGSLGPAWGATPYKTYVLKRYGSWDIVCEPYTVQKGDHIWEILRRKGCISKQDFPRFVSILKDLNPHIRNPDWIYPGQNILIPLKQVKAKTDVPDDSPRYVTIPIIPDVLYSTYEVRPGDCLSKIVTAQLGLSMEHIPDEYFKTLIRLNPDIKDTNRIYPGQKIRIPEIVSEAPAPGTAMTVPPLAKGPDSEPSEPPSTPVTPSSGRRAQESPRDLVSMALKGLGGTLIKSGHYFFPVKGEPDLKLDLSTFPVLELADGRRFLLDTGKGLPEDAEKTMRSFWKSLSIIHVDQGTAVPSVLDKILRAVYGGTVRQALDMPLLDEGIKLKLRGDWIFVKKEDKDTLLQHHCITLISHPEERTSAALRGYLAEKNILVSDLLLEPKHEMSNPESVKSTKSIIQILDARDQETFVAEFVRATGYTYDPHVPLSFYYAGLQVQTTADLIRGGNGLDTVVDFGTFYGEAKSAIESGGLKFLSIRPEDEALTIAKNILTVLGITFTENPVFLGANREVFKTISLTIPGLLSSDPDKGRSLLTTAQLHPRILDFLRERKIKVLQIRRG